MLASHKVPDKYDKTGRFIRDTLPLLDILLITCRQNSAFLQETRVFFFYIRFYIHKSTLYFQGLLTTTEKVQLHSKLEFLFIHFGIIIVYKKNLKNNNEK